MRRACVCFLLALTSCADPIDVGTSEQPVICDPHLVRYPIAGPYNGGYDPAWNDFRCDGARNNSDYGGSHEGNDLFAERGTPVVSPVDGVVLRAGVASSSSGNRVTVQDGCGWTYYHGHLDTIAPGIAPGVHVRAGDALGTVGNTGATGTAPHVHFNVSRDGVYSDDIDPFPLLEAVARTACGPDPECAGRGDGSFCVDATRIGTCTAGRFEVGDCGAYGTGCDMDTGAGRCTPHLDGVFTGSDFPGGTRIEVPRGGEVRGCLTYRNTGSWTWDGNTRLGTTEPRDRASEHAASDWLGPNRLASADHETARGGEARFCFSLRGAATNGERVERFSLVHEGYFWAADVGGVADDVNFLTVVTVEPAPEPMPDPMPEPMPDPMTEPVPDPMAEPLGDAGVPADAAVYEGPGRGSVEGGCAAAPQRGSRPVWIAWPLIALFVLRRRSREIRRTPSARKSTRRAR